MSTKLYESYKSLINYKKNIKYTIISTIISNIKDKIKTNVHFENTFKVKNKKDKTNYKLQLRNVDTNKREGIKMVQHF